MKKTIFTLGICLIVNFLHAQTISSQVIASGGNEFGTSNFTLTWTLGETAVSYYSISNGSLSEGFQQSFDIQTGFEEQIHPNNNVIQFYPNPASQTLNISINNPLVDKINIQVIDISGKVLINENIQNNQTIYPLNISQLPESTYFVKCNSTDGSIFKTLKFIKTK